MKEGMTFFGMTLVVLAGCYVYICSLGGFASTQPPLSSTQPPAASCGYQDYRCMARQDATNHGISADLYERQINQESGFNPRAVSPMGAIGIAQIMPSTAAGWHVDPWDPVASLSVAADHMHWYYQHYGYDYSKALSAYNAGTASTDSAIARYGANWRVGLPAETQYYILAIVGY